MNSSSLALLPDAPVHESPAADRFTAALVRLYPLVLKQARHLTGARADAEDLAQEALERALRARHLFRYGDSPDGWLRTIVHRLFVDQCRRRHRLPIQLRDPEDAGDPGAQRARHDGGTSEPQHQPGDPQDESSRWWEVLRGDDVKRMVRHLSLPLREVFVLRAFDGLSYSQIGIRLGIPSRTVGTRILRARRQLRRLLEADWDQRGVTPLHPPRPEPACPAPACSSACA